MFLLMKTEGYYFMYSGSIRSTRFQFDVEVTIGVKFLNLKHQTTDLITM